jgi:hypothetical protein
MRAIASAALFVLLSAAQPALSQVIEIYDMQLDGSGGLLLDGVEYVGDIFYGMDGSWTLEVDDSLWPDATDSTARFDYIWDTFFASHYDSTQGLTGWRARFDRTTLPTPPLLTLESDLPVGSLVMSESLSVLVRDYDGDGVLSQSEKHHTCQISMTGSVESPLCTGHFTDYCGNGRLGAGDFNFVNPPYSDELTLTAQIKVWYCGTAVIRSDWGAIKALFR